MDIEEKFIVACVRLEYLKKYYLGGNIHPTQEMFWRWWNHQAPS